MFPNKEHFFNYNLNNNMRKKLLWCLFVAFFSFQAAIAQNTTVTGKVTDEKGTPVEGAVITEKSASKNRTLSDASGAFRISVKTGAVLTVSSVGFEKKEATSQAVTNFTLKSLKEDLSEVVVTALGIKKEKKALGYAVSSIGKKDLEQKPEIDIARLLNGKAPGVNILNTSGLSGSGTNVVIRAVSTISGNSQPLWVVDGVPFDGGTNQQANFTYGNNTPSRFLDLDPNNVESIDVLKGLSATTLYGELGRNGVILVTTKNGSTQKTRKKNEVTVTQSYSVNQVANLPEYNESYGGGFDLSLGLAFFSNWGAKFTTPAQKVAHPYSRATLNAAFPEYVGNNDYEFKYYNSVSRFFRNGTSKNTSVNFAGSAQNVNYNINYGYTDDQGFVEGNGSIKNNISMGGTMKLTNKLTLNGTFNHVQTDVKSPPTSPSFGSTASNPSLYGDVMYTPTAVDLMGLEYQNPIDGSHVYYRGGNDIQNPRWTLKNSFTQDKVSRNYGQISANYDLSQKVKVQYRFGYDNYSNYQLYAQNKGGTYYPQGFLRTSTGNNAILDHTLTTTYKTDINNDFNLDVLAGVNSRDLSYSQMGVTSKEQLVFGLLDHTNFITHDIVNEAGADMDYKTRNLSIGAFTSATLGYKQFAYLVVGGRNSWTSTLEAANRSVFYPNISGSFIPTEAFEFLRNKKNVNYLKVRLGYSTAANFPGPYSTRSALSISTRNFVTASGAVVNTNSIPNFLPNPNLKPELMAETETGIEGKFFQSRLSTDITLYQRVSNDQILNRDLDPSTGYTSQQINAGKVTNKGIEAQLAYKIIRNQDWIWEVTGNYTLNQSLVSDIPSDLKEIVYAGYTTLGNFAINGQPLGIMKGYQFQRHPNGQLLVGAGGDYLASTTIGIIGDPNPKYRVSGINSVTYKSLTFRFQVDYTCGGDMYSSTARSLLARGVTKDTEFDRAAPYILPGVNANGEPNNIQISATQGYFNNVFGPDQAGIFDATVVRLRDMSLSYALPEKLLSKTPFGSLSITANGSNLWYYAPNFPKYMNFDPETNGLGVGNGKGLEFITGPSARRMGVSVRVTF
jgi:TonB-linked SusC/RagA family outer membrane protein